jgi:hypothetical protein
MTKADEAARRVRQWPARLARGTPDERVAARSAPKPEPEHRCDRCDREPRPFPRGLKPACHVGLTMSGTFTIGGRTYHQAYVHGRSEVVWPGDERFVVSAALAESGVQARDLVHERAMVQDLARTVARLRLDRPSRENEFLAEALESAHAQRAETDIRAWLQKIAADEPAVAEWLDDHPEDEHKEDA